MSTITEPSGYAAAHDGVALIDSGAGRTRLKVEGRAPEQMLTGILSGTMPPPLRKVEPGVLAGRAYPSTVLTPKGKLITELRLLRLPNSEAEEGARDPDAFLLDLPVAGFEGLREHFARYLPPRMARAHDHTEPLGALTVVGPGAASILSREALGLRVDAPELDALDEGELRILLDGSPVGIQVVRSAAATSPSFDVIADAGTTSALRERLLEAGAVEGDEALRTTLRIERGRPEFGVELDRDTLPPEAGLDPRAIDHAKGCYTGQEVIVRIRDRGRVNRHLRGLLFGEGPLPEPGTELWIDGRDRPGGEVRSAVYSPRFGQGIGLAMVRREADPPATVRVGETDGPAARLHALGEAGWIVEDGAE
ncbi:MAG: aminomethyl transferase family protein [Gemmatimonadales bacterium]|nr:MAG: aminomethyl transferase family protein [Gemmatimonadales bacterium]